MRCATGSGRARPSSRRSCRTWSHATAATTRPWSGRSDRGPRAARATSRTRSGFAGMGTAEAIYLLCAVASLVAAWMLFQYFLRRRTPLLFWSFIGFLGLAGNNVLVFLDLVIYPTADLSLARTLTGAIGM